MHLVPKFYTNAHYCIAVRVFLCKALVDRGVEVDAGAKYPFARARCLTLAEIQAIIDINILKDC